jgi:hypothetical protein
MAIQRLRPITLGSSTALPGSPPKRAGRFSAAWMTRWVWAWAGALLGSLCFASLLITQTPASKIGFLFGWPPSLVGGLLALAVALLGLSVALHVSRRAEAGVQVALLHWLFTPGALGPPSHWGHQFDQNESQNTPAATHS